MFSPENQKGKGYWLIYLGKTVKCTDNGSGNAHKPKWSDWKQDRSIYMLHNPSFVKQVTKRKMIKRIHKNINDDHFWEDIKFAYWGERIVIWTLTNLDPLLTCPVTSNQVFKPERWFSQLSKRGYKLPSWLRIKGENTQAVHAWPHSLYTVSLKEVFWGWRPTRFSWLINHVSLCCLIIVVNKRPVF